MKKITKKEGMEYLNETISKLVLTGYVDLKKANELLDMKNKEFIEKTKDISYRKVIKSNNNQVVFELLDGDVKGKKTWLTDLAKTTWYIYNNHNGKFIVIDFSSKSQFFKMTMAYQLF